MASPKQVFANAIKSDGFEFPLGKPNGDGYAVEGAGGLCFLYCRYDYQRDGIPEFHPGEDWNDNNSGLDFGGNNDDKGDPVYAVSNGTLRFAKFYNRSWGYLVMIEHEMPNGEKYWSQYAHLANIPDNLKNKKDITVIRGEQVGTVGDYWHGSGQAHHLHFEIRKKYRQAWDFVPNWTQQQILEYYIDPSDFINSHRPLPKALLTVTDSTDTTAKLSWKKPAINNFQKYSLYRSEVAGGTAVEVSRTLVSEFTNADTLEHTDTNLTPEKDYFYKLFAYDNNGNFSESEEVSVKTKEKTNQVINITQNEYYQNFPSIHGNRIVWLDGRLNDRNDYDPYLYYYDIEKKEVLHRDVRSSGARGVTNPVIYGNTVAFESVNQAKQGYGSNVYMYNFETSQATLLTENEMIGHQSYPDIYENFIVWQDERKGAAESDIHIIDISSGWQGEYPLVDTPGRQATPKIWGTKVVYVDTIVGQTSLKYDIVMIDIITKEKTVLAQKMAYAHPDIDSGKVSWLHNKKVYVYDVQTGATSTFDFGGEVTVSKINNNKIIYQKGLSELTELQMYDLTSQKNTILSSLKKGQSSFDLFENFLVFSDIGPNEKAASWSDIFLLEL